MMLVQWLEVGMCEKHHSRDSVMCEIKKDQNTDVFYSTLEQIFRYVKL